MQNHYAAQDEDQQHETLVMPVVEERAEVHNRTVETAAVRVTRTVHEHEQLIDEALGADTVSVERVPVNRVVETLIPDRQEGDTLVISVIEEFIVAEKRLLLKEEVRITRQHAEVHAPQSVKLRRAEVFIERVPGDG